MSRKFGVCPKCKTEQKLTNHHIFPICFWGKNGDKVLICRGCHDDLEYFITRIEGRTRKGKRNQLPRISYFNIYLLFIEGYS